VSYRRTDGIPIEDRLRERWLVAIAELGTEGAVNDAAEAFALRLGCDISEGRAIALRAFRTLALPGCAS
jgi:hypothetical protein